MTGGQKADISRLPIDSTIDRIPTQMMCQVLGIGIRHLRRISSLLRECEIDGFDHQKYDKRYSREAAEIIWRFYHLQKLDGLKKALYTIAGLENE
jgi:hypothetical protein